MKSLTTEERRNGVTAEADATELPSVLASPPWAKVGSKKEKKTKPLVLPLRMLPFEEQVVWSDAPRPDAPSVATKTQDEKVLVLEKKAKSGDRAFLWELRDLSDDAARDAFTRFPAELWHDWALGDDLAVQLARFGVPAIDPCLRFAKKKPADVASALEAAVSPRVAPIMAHVLVRVKKMRRVAERWLVRNPRPAAIALLVDLFGLGVDPRVRENAGRALRFMASRGKRPVIEEVGEAYGEEVAAALANALSADSLAEGAPSKPPKMPAWFAPASLPRPRLEGSRKAVPLEAVQRIGEMLAFTDPDEPYIGIEQVDDDAFVLPAGARIGVVHPLEMDAKALAKWGERLSEYEILQPFPQLGREVPRNVKRADLGAFASVDSLKLLGLERRGWRRGPVGDGGVVWQLEKEAGALRASLTIEPGLYAGDPKMNPTQTPQELDFANAAVGRVHDPDTIFLAEVAADLRAVGALI